VSGNGEGGGPGSGGQKVKLNKTQLRKERQRQQWLLEKQQQLQKVQQKKKKPTKDPKKIQVRQQLSNHLLYGVSAIDHILLSAGLRLDITIAALTPSHFDSLLHSIRTFETQIYESSPTFFGYLLHKPGAERVKVDRLRQPKKTAKEMQNEVEGEVAQIPTEDEPLYFGYAPFPYANHEKGFIRIQVKRRGR
jgi:hypothetical protein